MHLMELLDGVQQIQKILQSQQALLHSSHVGNYTLTVTDINGCQSSDVVAVTSSPIISTTASFSTFTSCAGSAGTEQSFTISGNELNK